MPSADAAHVVYQEAGGDGVGRLMLARPEKLNATNSQTLRDLDRCVAAAEADAGARAVIVGGKGRAFCAGIDLAALSHGALPDDWYERWERVLFRLEALRSPTVAAIEGACLGGGLQIVLCCDLRVATENATFGLSAVKHGIIPGLATYRLPRFIGMGAAREMMLLGETWDAQRAQRHRLVDRVVATDNSQLPSLYDIRHCQNEGL